MTPIPTDGDLLLAWRQGDTRAGSMLYKRLFTRLWRFFAPRVGDGVEDLIQETMQSVLEGHDRLRQSRSFRAFVLGIARHKLLHYYRRKRQRPAHDELEGPAIPDPRTGASELVRRRSTHQRLAQALLMLPLDQQLLIELTYWANLTSIEIGEILDMPPSTIRSRRRTAEKALHRLIGGREEPSPADLY